MPKYAGYSSRWFEQRAYPKPFILRCRMGGRKEFDIEKPKIFPTLSMNTRFRRSILCFPENWSKSSTSWSFSRSNVLSGQFNKKSITSCCKIGSFCLFNIQFPNSILSEKRRFLSVSIKIKTHLMSTIAVLDSTNLEKLIEVLGGRTR